MKKLFVAVLGIAFALACGIFIGYEIHPNMVEEPVTEEQTIEEAVTKYLVNSSIRKTEVIDNVKVVSVTPDENYGGYKVTATFDRASIPCSIDVAMNILGPIEW